MTAPGATARFEQVRNRFATIDTVLHSSAERRSDTVVLFTHPRSQTNLTAYPLPDLAARGVDGLAFNNRFTNSPAGTDVATVFEEFALDVAAAVEHARALGYPNTVLMGWSAGGPVMAFYQNVAEHGNEAIRPDTLSRFPGFFDGGGVPLELPPADGLILRSVTIGTAASFLFRLDGSVTDEETVAIDPTLDMYDAQNGFDPATGRARYDPRFLDRYFRAQAERMMRIVDRSEERLAAIEAGAGRFSDDDFVVVPRTRANPLNTDGSLAAESRAPHMLHPSGTRQTIRDVRPLSGEGRLNRMATGAAVHKLRALLSYRLTRVDPERFDPFAVSAAECGIDLASTNNSTPTNLAGVSVPLLILQGTGDPSNSVKLPSAELNLAAAASRSKDLAFIEGADHSMRPVDPRYGDTRALGAGVVADWIGERFGPS
jgi:pimeloyl-ACP methyl ester carboxylesterase